MKKFSLLLLTMALLLLCSAQASNIDKAVLTAEPWVNPFGTQLVFGANSKGKMVAPTGDVTNFDYEVSGDSVTYTYKFWGDFTTGATFVYGEEDGIRFLCLDEAGKLTSASYYQASKIDTVRQMAEEKLETYAVQFGEKIDLGFMEYTPETLQNTFTIESSGVDMGGSYQAGDGRKYVAVYGTVKNTGKRELKIENISCTLTLDNGKSYAGSAEVDTANQLGDTLAPTKSGTLILFFAVPEGEADSYASADVVLAMRDELSANVAFPGFGDFVFELHVDKAMAAAAKQEPARTKVYIEESPALPSPESYGDCYKSGSNVSETNGKVTQISCSYKPYDSNKARSLLQAYRAGLIADGYTVSGSASNFTVSLSNTKLAEVSLQSGTIKMSIMPGNEKMKPAKK